jgi:hypothetical protein
LISLISLLQHQGLLTVVCVIQLHFALLNYNFQLPFKFLPGSTDFGLTGNISTFDVFLDSDSFHFSTFRRACCRL